MKSKEEVEAILNSEKVDKHLRLYTIIATSGFTFEDVTAMLVAFIDEAYPDITPDTFMELLNILKDTFAQTEEELNQLT